MAEKDRRTELLALTAEIVASHVSNNRVDAGDLPNLIRSVFGALSGAEGGAAAPAARPAPAVPVKRSVTADHVACLECGKKQKMLKRHLRTAHDLSVEQYRQRWDLDADYPVVAPNYALRRRALAKKIGLGTGKRRARR